MAKRTLNLLSLFASTLANYLLQLNKLKMYLNIKMTGEVSSMGKNRKKQKITSESVMAKPYDSDTLYLDSPSEQEIDSDESFEQSSFETSDFSDIEEDLQPRKRKLTKNKTEFLEEDDYHGNTSDPTQRAESKLSEDDEENKLLKLKKLEQILKDPHLERERVKQILKEAKKIIGSKKNDWPTNLKTVYVLLSKQVHLYLNNLSQKRLGNKKHKKNQKLKETNITLLTNCKTIQEEKEVLEEMLSVQQPHLVPQAQLLRRIIKSRNDFAKLEKQLEESEQQNRSLKQENQKLKTKISHLPELIQEMKERNETFRQGIKLLRTRNFNQPPMQSSNTSREDQEVAQDFEDFNSDAPVFDIQQFFTETLQSLTDFQNTEFSPEQPPAETFGIVLQPTSFGSSDFWIPEPIQGTPLEFLPTQDGQITSPSANFPAPPPSCFPPPS